MEQNQIIEFVLSKSTEFGLIHEHRAAYGIDMFFLGNSTHFPRGNIAHFMTVGPGYVTMYTDAKLVDGSYAIIKFDSFISIQDPVQIPLYKFDPAYFTETVMLLREKVDRFNKDIERQTIRRSQDSLETLVRT